MRKLIKITFRLILIIITLALLYFIGILLINAVYDYQPEGRNYQVGAFLNYPLLETGKQYSAISWNIGYGGLGKEADFFYDGGSMSRPGKEMFDRYCMGIDKRLLSFDTIDFIMLQEVDMLSRRSYHLKQPEIVKMLFPGYESLYAVNYNVQFVPLPLFNPMGGVLSGLQLLGKHKLISASWRPFEKDPSWPLSLFKPDRCYQVAEFGISNFRRLYVVHTHNSAFDDGTQREGQIEMLYAEMLKAYKLGHYVIAGGDWNLNPSGWTGKQYISNDIPFLLPQQALEIPGKGWQIVFDTDFPTNRDVSGPYIQGITPCTIIDFFICSPNIEVKEIRTLYNDFDFSDHQPVYLSFELKH